MKIFLIGMPGAGKSTLGPQLADLLNCPFLDLDTEIAKGAGAGIPEIFAQQGEAGFRKLETETLRTVADSTENLVIATGGGTPCFHRNMEFMNNCGQTVYLETAPEILAARLCQKEMEGRPLLKGKTFTQLLNYLQETLARRATFYRQAGIIFENNSSAVSPRELAGLILKTQTG
jgi:shikimate kinase